MTLWEIDIHPARGQPDLEGQRTAAEAADLGLVDGLVVRTAHGYLIDGDLRADQIQRLARELLADTIVESVVVARVGDDCLLHSPEGNGRLVQVLPKPGVMDPVAQSALAAMREMDVSAHAVRTLKKYWLSDLSEPQLESLCGKILANDSIEEVVVGPLVLDRLEVRQPYQFRLATVPLGKLDDEGLMRLSHTSQLYLSLAEMQTIQSHFRQLGRDPTDAELETVAQTWSEHCSHKTLAGRISYTDEHGRRQFQNMLKETIFAATAKIRGQLGDEDWCVSVFEDNAGIVRFDDADNVVFKVETHNHPSALEPYGGANTGIGGVIRDPMGTGLGAKPVCNTDVFCFAPPETPLDQLPPGVLHPCRVLKGVVAGVRDYGNRMGIPTVNGAIYFDPRYLGNPLVYCGNVGMIPRDKSSKAPRAGDHIVAVGGRTGRDGIHGATFSSTELTSESESISGGAVQIGNAITEKMMLDVLLVARDRDLYNSVTDCGAGGFSSAIGEMGESIGVEVWLDRAPLKYEGLSYTEIWISEAQERMVLAVAPEKWESFSRLCASEGVEATILGRFVPSGRLQLKYHDVEVANLSMEFLHGGRPPIVRQATYTPAPRKALRIPNPSESNYTDQLLRILGSLNVASKEWVIRQYDHEVQGGSVIKPLVGVDNDGPSDAAVIRPNLSSWRGLAISCGMNPRYGELDTYDMAASAIDEAVRNCVAVGANPQRIAILDNFCWGNTERAETLGSLVRAALACHDVAVALGTPFISGKDSLNNEFSYQDQSGRKQTVSIPPSLLISAMGQVDDVRQCISMDLKRPGNPLYLVGKTHHELGGSHLALVEGLAGGDVPRVDAVEARRTFEAIHRAINSGLICSCHDLSEGGLAVALAEMAFAGGYGARVPLEKVLHEVDAAESLAAILLFSESNSRFVCEVPRDHFRDFERMLVAVPHAMIGEVNDSGRLTVLGLTSPTIGGMPDEAGTSNAPVAVDCDLATLKEAWQAPLRW